MGDTVLMTKAEAAAALKVCEKTITRMVRREELKAVKIGRYVRVRAAGVKKLLNAA